MPPCEQITLAILAGGKGSRMGQPKALLQLHGQPILAYLVQRLAWPGPKLLITAPGTEHPPGSDAFDHELIDPEPNAGPLRGILTALEHLQTPLLIITTVDMPAIPRAALENLLTELSKTESQLGLMYFRPSPQKQIIEPFPLALRKQAIDPIRAQFHAGQRSVHKLLTNPHFSTIPAPPDDSIWINLNHPDDLNRWNATRAEPL